jgi:3-isopropylmalate/(R)-2-methylmalate dehydratase large subunit
MLTHVEFPGRILFLSDEPAKLADQFAGTDLVLQDALSLRSDVSTDEITPIPTLVHYDAAIARFAHTGFEARGERPIGEGAVADGGFSVIVGGNRYGKGSSREHSPLAEVRAGIKLIIAESFERLYRQNADNLGLFTCTDFGLIDRIRSGEAIPIEDLLAGRDPQAQDILRAGGLLGYGRAIAPTVTPLPEQRWQQVGPMTYAEKIIARHAVDVVGRPWGLEPGSAGFVRPAWRYFHDIYTAMCGNLLEEFYGDGLTFDDPSSVVSFEDHYSYAHRPEVNAKIDRMPGIRRMSNGHRAFVSKYGLHDHGYLTGEEGSEGISHAVMTEHYVLPGQLAAGTDSHTPHCGALGALAYGVGSTEMANALMTGLTRIKVPETVGVHLTGDLPTGVMAKDVVLHLLADPFVREGGGIGRVFEFSGPAAIRFSTDERATLTNMTAEMGGLTGIFIPDEETLRFLKQRRGIDVAVEPWMRSDPGAAYAHEIEIDCTRLSPMLASPGDPGNGLRVSELKDAVKVTIAYGGSCTAGKREDFDGYHEVLKWAADRGLSVPEGVKLYLQFGSMAVRDYCRDKGYLDTFDRVGAEILNPACGACAGCGPGLSVTGDQVTISAINRNFPGRSGPGKVWLASPMTVAASAIAGEIISFAELHRMSD